MVQPVTANDMCNTLSATTTESFVATNTASSTTSTPKTTAGCFQLVRKHLGGQQISAETAELIEASWRNSTKSQYRSYFQKWMLFCGERQADPFTTSVPLILEFLTMLFKKGLSYSALNTARSAISSFLSCGISANGLGDQPLIKRFMKGVFNTRPALPRYNKTWDVNIVLSYLVSLSPVNSLSLRVLTLKLVMLLAILTGQRLQTLAALHLDCIDMSTSGVTITVNEMLKTTKPGTHLKPIYLPVFTPDRRICVVNTLTEYIKRTSRLRGTNKKLLLSYVGPHKPVTPTTIGKWIKYMLSVSKIDISMYKSHSTRSASATAASKSGLNVSDIMKAIGWKQESTFRKFYQKPVTSFPEKDTLSRCILDNFHNAHTHM